MSPRRRDHAPRYNFLPGYRRQNLGQELITYVTFEEQGHPAVDGRSKSPTLPHRTREGWGTRLWSSRSGGSDPFLYAAFDWSQRR